MYRAIILILFLLLPIPAESIIRYSIDATYDPMAGTIHGTLNARFNGLRDPFIFLYPNIYLKEGPQESYPAGYNAGYIRIISLRDGNNNSLKTESIEKDKAFKIISGHNLSEINIEFLTRIPERFGVFGHYDGITTLQGGWHPLVASSLDEELPSSDYSVRIIVPFSYNVLNTGSRMKEMRYENKKIIEFKAEGIKTPTLVMSKESIRNVNLVNDISFDLLFLKKDKWYIERASEVLEGADSFFKNNVLTPSIKSIGIGEVYLYSDMAVAGEDVILVSNRLFKVYPYLRRFHERQLVKSLYTIYLRSILRDEEWVSEGMAEYMTELYIRERYPEAPDLVKSIKTFSFIPAVDYIIYSHKLPLRRVYFFKEFISGPGEDIRNFNNERLEGGMIFSKLRNIIGEEEFKNVISGYMRVLKDFRKTSSDISGRDLGWFYHQWLKEIPKTDYYLKDVNRGKGGESYITEIKVGKKGDAVEPVELYTEDSDGREDRERWNGEGNEFIFEKHTSSPIKVIEIDPDGKLSDSDRYNNRIPQRWKLLVNRFRLSYDFQIHKLEGDIIVSLQRQYDMNNRYTFNYYHRFEADGFRSGYDYIRGNRTISFSLGIEKLSGEFSRFEGRRYIISPVLYYKMGGIELMLEPAAKLFGSDYSFLKFQLTAIKEFKFARYRSVALRVIQGQSDGEMPEHKLFFLGGILGARGFSKAEDKAKNISLFTAEYRFPLINDLDQDLFGLLTAHTLQIALFADTGMVTDKRDTFRFSEYKHDIGIGFRFHANLFGIYPGIGRIDIAMPVGPDVRHHLAYYISIGQSF